MILFGWLMTQCTGSPLHRFTAPKTSRNSVLGKAGEISSIVTASLLTGFAEKASATPKAQYEYQPALEGLDYGKPRTYY